MKTKGFCLSAVFLFAQLALALTVSAQPPAREPNKDPRTKPIKAKSEMKDAHKRWLAEDAGPIITEAERKAFLALKTDEERENFIAWFWDKRDPNPDTEENEYREEYYERIAYANEHFTSGIPGWKTDRGRIYIRWGKPDSVEARPSGGSYDRPSYEGGGSTTVYPFETWFYRHLDGVGDGIEVEFVDPSGTGEYRIARNADEKDALAMVPGAGLKSAELFGFGNKADRLTNSNPSYQREQDGFFRRQEILKGLETPPGAKGAPDWLSNTTVATLNENPINVVSRVDFFRLSDDKVMVAFTVQTDNRDLKFEPVGGLETARLNIFGRITSVAGKRTGIFEDSATTTATTTELAELKDRRSIYQKMIALSPGTYKIDLAVRDVVTGNQGMVRQGFTVPRYDDVKLATSSLVLASRLRPSDAADTGKMFVIGNAKVVPNLAETYRQGQQVGLYMQIYNAGIDQTTLRPAVDVEYVLTQGSKEILRQTEDWSGLSDSGQRLTLGRLLPTEALSPGEYEIKVVTKDRVGGQAIERMSRFTVTK